MASNDAKGVAVAQPATTEERTSVASTCSGTLKMTILLIVDGVDDAVGRAYSGLPDRLYLLDKRGRVAYKGGRDPFGFKPGELEQAIVMMLLDESGQIERGVGEPVDFDPWAVLPKAEAGTGQPLPNWVAPLAAAMPKTTAAMLEADYVQRAKNPVPPAL